ncbi:hypothetical protein ACT54M_12690 [Leptospira santarosai]|uniref:Uncharacterized protein n=1 Tax=Leptospira santarosai TaxID=28183 RepID=A0A2P1QR98_9LEPT|nr:hypothetical protein [Leptospira santarosai]AVQ11257.1 Uncharacterized protein XB16_0922 [Leptospira santarosai]OLY59610.1 hypothetical protein BV917_15235 [Leptospira santarosai serovar Guaricura]
MDKNLRDSIIWHFRERYSVMKTWEILEWSYPRLKFKEVKEVFDELESQIPKAGIRKKTLAV